MHISGICALAFYQAVPLLPCVVQIDKTLGKTIDMDDVNCICNNKKSNLKNSLILKRFTFIQTVLWDFRNIVSFPSVHRYYILQ